MELKKLVAAETQKQIEAQSNKAQVMKIPAKVLRGIGSPRAVKNGVPSIEASPLVKTARINRNLATSPRPVTANIRNLITPKDMAVSTSSSLRTNGIRSSATLTKNPGSPNKASTKIFKPNFE